MTTILIAEDHKIFNDGLKSLLSDDFEILCQVFEGKEVMPMVQKYTPQILLLDINLPQKNGLEIGKELKASFPNVKLVYLSMYTEQAFLKTAKEVGADGYLLKDTAGNEILDALKRISKGEKVFDSRLNESIPNFHHDDFFVREFSLSKREIEIIKLMKEGLSSTKIADKLFVSYETIKSHKKNIYLKLNINKLSDLILFTSKHGL